MRPPAVAVSKEGGQPCGAHGAAVAGSRVDLAHMLASLRFKVLWGLQNTGRFTPQTGLNRVASVSRYRKSTIQEWVGEVEYGFFNGLLSKFHSKLTPLILV